MECSAILVGQVQEPVRRGARSRRNAMAKGERLRYVPPKQVPLHPSLLGRRAPRPEHSGARSAFWWLTDAEVPGGELTTPPPAQPGEGDGGKLLDSSAASERNTPARKLSWVAGHTPSFPPILSPRTKALRRARAGGRWSSSAPNTATAYRRGGGGPHGLAASARRRPGAGAWARPTW